MPPTRLKVRYNLTDKQFNSIITIGMKKHIESCSICLEKIDAEYGELECGHIYHIDCIKTWLMRHSLSCPYCRIKVDTGFILKTIVNILKYIFENIFRFFIYIV